MRRIKKGTEPRCLADLRGTPGADWTSVHGTQRQEIRERSFTDQGGLCAYCMSRLPVPPSDAGMKIEHFETRALQPALKFEWNNLLGVCLGDVGIEEGSSGETVARFHCDTFRGHLKPPEAQRLPLNPAVFPPDVETYFSYTKEGEIRPAADLDEPARAQAEMMIEKLNLNVARLRRNRASVIGVLRANFQKKKPTRARVTELLELASRPNREGLLQPYCQTAIYYLAKKLRQLGA